jgi:hypothetical protein
MAAPNIVNVITITGVTTFLSGISTTTGSVIISNATSSNQVYKLNTLMASNTTSTIANITVKLFNGAAGAGTSVSIASTISIPSGSSLVIVGKDTPIYIEENRSITAIASSISAIDVIASYEVIS